MKVACSTRLGRLNVPPTHQTPAPVSILAHPPSPCPLLAGPKLHLKRIGSSRKRRNSKEFCLAGADDARCYELGHRFLELGVLTQVSRSAAWPCNAREIIVRQSHSGSVDGANEASHAVPSDIICFCASCGLFCISFKNILI